MIRDFDPDVMHVVNPALIGAAGIYYGKRLNYPLLASFHTQVPKYADYYHLSIFKGLLWWYFRKLHNNADLNLCTSQVVHKELVEQNFKNLHVWKRGVDTSLFHPRNFHKKNAGDFIWRPYR